MLVEYQVAGKTVVAMRSSDAPPRLLLIHGAGGNHRAFDELVANLSMSCVVPSLPGRCGSEGPPPANVGEAARWVTKFIREARLGPIVICGHSFGGAIALEVALLLREEPNLAVCGLVLMATGARLRVRPTILQIMEDAAERGEAASLVPIAFSSSTGEALTKDYDERLRRTPPAAALADWLASDSFDRMSTLQGIELPSLVLCGELDSLTPRKFSQYLHEHLGQSTLVELEACGHMFPVEAAKETSTQIDQFLTTLFADKGT